MVYQYSQILVYLHGIEQASINLKQKILEQVWRSIAQCFRTRYLMLCVQIMYFNLLFGNGLFS